MWYSEYGQDRWLEENVFKGKRHGVFFEAGALDGILHSNSLYFERYNNWTGVLMEANTDLHELIKHNRPGSSVIHGALWGDAGYRAFQKVSGPLYGWSGLYESKNKQDIDKINRNIPKDFITTTLVPCYALNAVLGNFGINRIDYLSLDIEGAEYEVLRVFPFHKYDIDVIGVEDNSGCNAALANLLIDSGYKKLIRLGVDDIWRKA